MKFKAIILIVIIVIVGGFLLVKIGGCGPDKSLAAEKKKHKETKEQLEADIKVIEEDRETKNKKITSLRDSLKKQKKARNERDKKIADLECEIKDIPKPTGEFKTLPEAQREFDKLWIGYEKRGGLIIELESQIVSFKESEKDYDALDLEYNEREVTWKAEKAKWKEKEDEDARHIAALKKLRKKRFSIVLGPGFGINGKFSIMLCIGYDITGLLK